MAITHYKRGHDGRPCAETASIGAICERFGMTEYAVNIALNHMSITAQDAIWKISNGDLCSADVMRAYMEAPLDMEGV